MFLVNNHWQWHCVSVSPSWWGQSVAAISPAVPNMGANYKRTSLVQSSAEHSRTTQVRMRQCSNIANSMLVDCFTCSMLIWTYLCVDMLVTFAQLCHTDSDCRAVNVRVARLLIHARGAYKRAKLCGSANTEFTQRGVKHLLAQYVASKRTFYRMDWFNSGLGTSCSCKLCFPACTGAVSTCYIVACSQLCFGSTIL